MGQFLFRNRIWNQNRPLFKLDGIGIGIESTTKFSVGIDPARNWNRNLSIPSLPIEYESGYSNGIKIPESESTPMESESNTSFYARIGIGIGI